ncbi:hypothetical protein BD779DRAFT_552536 [Infundibulicybe gibba]|nr:hypothetical protein BD779DRAFT_552536 [Infundibulicybe gibba]
MLVHPSPLIHSPLLSRKREAPAISLANEGIYNWSRLYCNVGPHICVVSIIPFLREASRMKWIVLGTRTAPHALKTSFVTSFDVRNDASRPNAGEYDAGGLRLICVVLYVLRVWCLRVQVWCVFFIPVLDLFTPESFKTLGDRVRCFRRPELSATDGA